MGGHQTNTPVDSTCSVVGGVVLLLGTCHFHWILTSHTRLQPTVQQHCHGLRTPALDQVAHTHAHQHKPPVFRLCHTVRWMEFCCFSNPSQLNRRAFKIISQLSTGNFSELCPGSVWIHLWPAKHFSLLFAGATLLWPEQQRPCCFSETLQ